MNADRLVGQFAKKKADTASAENDWKSMRGGEI